MSIGDEDVLVGDEPDPGEPAPRTRFTRRRDIVAAVLIAVVALVVGILVWHSSDIRATSSQTYDGPAPSPAQPTEFPPSLGEAWRARSPATPQPVTVGPAVVTGDGGEVAGRDPLSGKVRWRYHRDLPLCTLAGAWTMAVAVYEKSANLLPDDDPRKAGGCSEVTAFDPATGKRGRQPGPGEEPRDKPDSGQRNSDAELGTRLLFDGSYVTTTGNRLLTTWRSDLVQTMEYGTVPALVNPEKQPRSGCEFKTVAVVQSRIAVIEDCPDDDGDRLTVYRATGNDDSEKPEVVASVGVANDTRVVAMTDQCRLDPTNEEDVQQCTALVEPDPARLLVLDERGEQVADYPLPPGSGAGPQPADHVVPTIRTPVAVYWFTGSSTIALSTADLSPLWTVEDSLGPGTMFAGQMLVPVRDGLRVLRPATGEPVGTLPVDRGEHTGLVTMSTLGPVVYEQRADTLVALR